MANTRKGFSLIEAAVLLGIISLFFVPVAMMSGGAGQGTSLGKTATDSNRNRVREVTAANALMEQALVGNIAVPSFDWKTLNPNTLYDSGILQTSDYSQKVNYDWLLQNNSFQIDRNGNLLKDSSGQPVKLVTGNYLASATLRLFPRSGNSPTLVLPTTLAAKDPVTQQPQNTKIGVMLVLDTSGSMAWSSKDYSLPYTTAPSDPTPLVVSSPYLTYRNDLNLNDNSQLDIVADLRSDNPVTPYDETYIPGSSTGKGVAQNVHLKPGCATNVANSSYFIPEAMNGAAPIRTHAAGPQKPLQWYIQDLCSINAATTDVQWQTSLNESMSRIEAARTALFAFLIRLESNPFLSKILKIGFETFNTVSPYDPTADIEVRAPLEDISATTHNFPKTRQWVSYINRMQSNGQVLVNVVGGTPTYPALVQAANLLYADKTLTDRIIILMTDGVPTAPNQDLIPALMNQLGAGTFNGANGKAISVISVGLIGGNQAALDNWAAQNTAGGGNGASFFAASVADTLGILDGVADQVVQSALNSSSCRYNVNAANSACSP